MGEADEALPASEKELTRRQILLREVNERVHDVMPAGSPAADATDFLCECSGECTETVALTDEEYEAVRSSGARFVVVPGHETPAVETVVAREAHFLVVENTVQADLALADDPRRLRDPAAGRTSYGTG